MRWPRDRAVAAVRLCLRVRCTSKFIPHACDLGDRARPRTEKGANRTEQEERVRGHHCKDICIHK